MSIITTKLEEKAYENKFMELIKSLEGYEPNVYYKKGDTPTIGYGLALFTKETGNLNTNAINDLRNAGVIISDDDYKTLNRIEPYMQELATKTKELKNAMNNKQPTTKIKEDIKTLQGTVAKEVENLNLNLTDPYTAVDISAMIDLVSTMHRAYKMADRILENTLKHYSPEKLKDFLEKKLGNSNETETLYNNLQNSKEIIPLLSLLYNGGTELIGPGLRHALEHGNRAEAWFQIRYNTNAGTSRGKGIAKRRVEESNLFGLYNKTLNVNNPSKEDLEDMKDIIRMVGNHKNNNKIIREEKAFPAHGNLPNPYAGDNSIVKQIELAKIILINKYGKDVKIDGKSILTKDWITGDEKDNTLNGNKKDNILYGGKGADKLYGGKGYDTYIAGAGDTIKDTDNKGKIYFDATLLSGTKHKVSENTYEDKMFTYTLDNKNLIITQKADTSKSITVENWSKNKKALGIILSDEKTAEHQADPSNRNTSLLHPDARYDNTRIAESSTNENKENLASIEGLAYVPGVMILPISTTIDAKDVVLASDTTNTNDDDNGMVM